jgi:hypothetical protein
MEQTPLKKVMLRAVELADQAHKRGEWHESKFISGSEVKQLPNGEIQVLIYETTRKRFA